MRSVARVAAHAGASAYTTRAVAVPSDVVRMELTQTSEVRLQGRRRHGGGTGVLRPRTAMKRWEKASCLTPGHEVAITRRRLVPEKRYASVAGSVALSRSFFTRRTLVASGSGRSDQGSFAGIFSADPTAVLIVIRPNTEAPRTQLRERSITRTLPRRQSPTTGDPPRRPGRPHLMHYLVLVAEVEARLSSTLPNAEIFSP